MFDSTDAGFTPVHCFHRYSPTINPITQSQELRFFFWRFSSGTGHPFRFEKRHHEILVAFFRGPLRMGLTEPPHTNRFASEKSIVVRNNKFD